MTETIMMDGAGLVSLVIGSFVVGKLTDGRIEVINLFQQSEKPAHLEYVAHMRAQAYDHGATACAHQFVGHPQYGSQAIARAVRQLREVEYNEADSFVNFCPNQFLEFIRSCLVQALDRTNDKDFIAYFGLDWHKSPGLTAVSIISTALSKFIRLRQ